MLFSKYLKPVAVVLLIISIAVVGVFLGRSEENLLKDIEHTELIYTEEEECFGGSECNNEASLRLVAINADADAVYRQLAANLVEGGWSFDNAVNNRLLNDVEAVLTTEGNTTIGGNEIEQMTAEGRAVSAFLLMSGNPFNENIIRNDKKNLGIQTLFSDISDIENKSYVLTSTFPISTEQSQVVIDHLAANPDDFILSLSVFTR